MSEAFSSYQTKTGWNCLAGCGRCCLNPEVEATPLEMLPMAVEIAEEGKLEEWLEKLDTNSSGACLVFVPGSAPGEGKCGRYETRPAVCRMFGVAGYYDKSHTLTLSVCKYIKEAYQLSSRPDSDSSMAVPMISDWFQRLATLHPDLATKKEPLNKALHAALMKVALYQQYSSSSSD